MAVVGREEADPYHRQEAVAELENEDFGNEVVLVLSVRPMCLPVVEHLLSRAEL